jgi:hypothetical protein
MACRKPPLTMAGVQPMPESAAIVAFAVGSTVST